VNQSVEKMPTVNIPTKEEPCAFAIQVHSAILMQYAVLRIRAVAVAQMRSAVNKMGKWNVHASVGTKAMLIRTVKT
jgi:hypothetical protein